MEEENYDIYGDLESFEFGEKLKEKNDEIESLTERLNQSVVVITELEQENKKLKKDNRVLHRNTSSLLLTAKLELNRKAREISLLQQKLDNKIFRRRNNFSIAIQTDVTIHPSFKSHTQCQSENKVEDSTVHKQKINSCDENLVPPVALSVADNVRGSVSNFRIPKKNPNARLVNMNDRTKLSSLACVVEKSTDIQIDIEEQQNNGIKKYHIPKKNPSARRLDVVEIVSSDATRDDHSKERISIIESRDKVHTELRKNVISSNRRIEGDKPSNEYVCWKDNRKNQRNQRTTAPHYLDKGRTKDGYAYSDERRCDVRNVSSLKRARGRDESDERERHSKLSRYTSKSNNYQRSRSRSKSARSRSKSALSRSKLARSRSKSARSRSKSARSRSKSARSRSKSARSRSKSARSKSKSARSRSKSTHSGHKSARPRSKSARRKEEATEDKLTNNTNLTANDLKSQKQEKSQNMDTNGDASLSEIADKELEAILLAKTRILQDIEKEKSTVETHKQLHKEIAPEEPRKKIGLRAYQQRKTPTVNNCSNTTNEQCSEDPIDTTKKVTSNSISGKEGNFVLDTLAALAETTGVSEVDQMKIIESDTVYEDFESNVHPSATGNNQRNSTVVIFQDAIVPPLDMASLPCQTLDGKITTPINETPNEATLVAIVPSLDPASLPSQTLDGKVTTPINETPNEATLVENNRQMLNTTENRLENNENSNSAMDIDYELTVLPTFEGKMNVTDQQFSKIPLLPVDQQDATAENSQSSGALSNKSPQKMPRVTVENVVEKHAPEIHVIDENKNEGASAKIQSSVALSNKSPQKMPRVTVENVVEKHAPEIHVIDENEGASAKRSQSSVALSNKSPQKMPRVTVENVVEKSVPEVYVTDENKNEDASAKNSRSPVALSSMSPQKMPTVTVENVMEKQVPEIHDIDENKVEDSSAKKRQSSVAFSNKSPQQMSMLTVENVVGSDVPDTYVIGENKDISNVNDSLNSSFERHVMSKTMEYTVQDVGHEVRIYLTKKRKKSRKDRIVVHL